MRILATGTGTPFSARLLQGFAPHGVELTAVDSQRWSCGKVLPNVGCRLQVPPPGHHPDIYVERVERELRERRYDLLLPTFEEGLLLAEHADTLRRWTTLLLSPFETIWSLHHKPSLHDVCVRLGIPTPRIATPQTAAELEQFISQSPLRFPVVLKPASGNNSAGRVFCDSADSLREMFVRQICEAGRPQTEPPFIQEKIDSDAIYTLMLCHQGRKLAEVIYRPLRMYPDNAGTSVIRESITHPQIADITSTLVAATEWTGFLGLDFLVEHGTGTPFLIDANPRPNPAIQLGFVAGIDWSGMLLEIARGHTPRPVSPRVGVRVRSPLLDWAWVIEGWKPGPRRWATGIGRLKELLHPPWPLDAKSDVADECGGRRCRAAIAWLGFTSILRTLRTGRPLSQTTLEDLSYDGRVAQAAALLPVCQ